MISGVFDRAGNPITHDEWMVLRGDDPDKDRMRVGLWLSPDGEVRVSTVWMGLDHSFGDGPKEIFETMIFGGEYDQECTRYSNEVEALEGHHRTVLAFLEGHVPWFAGGSQ
jgi:hypothetical protein